MPFAQLALDPHVVSFVQRARKCGVQAVVEGEVHVSRGNPLLNLDSAQPARIRARRGKSGVDGFVVQISDHRAHVALGVDPATLEASPEKGPVPLLSAIGVASIAVLDSLHGHLELAVHAAQDQVEMRR